MNWLLEKLELFILKTDKNTAYCDPAKRRQVRFQVLQTVKSDIHPQSQTMKEQTETINNTTCF